MKVQTKILLLLLVVSALFGGGLATMGLRDRARFRSISDERRLEREKSFDAFLTRHSDPLQIYAKDTSVTTDLVRAIRSNGQQWGDLAINDNVLNSFGVDAAWVCRPDGSPVFDHNRLDVDDLKILPLPPAAFTALRQQRLMHFYLWVKRNGQDALLEVSADTVRPSDDKERRQPVEGFFLAGRLWNKEKIDLLASDTDNHLELTRATPADALPDDNEAERGILTFTRTLSTWDDQPAGRLVVTNESKIIRQLNGSNQQMLTLLLAFAAVTSVLLAVSLTRWVSRPLRLISRTLETQHPGPANRLRGDQSEFGGIARMLCDFFGQREKLLTEINGREGAREALRQSDEQRRQAQKMEAVGRLAGGVAHDFNNLLTAILGHAELLGNRRDLDASARQHVETIQKAGEQAAAVTHQLLAFSRKQMLQPRILELGPLVQDFGKILRCTLGEHIELRVEIEPGGRVKADPNQLEQVLLNLGVNARDAMPRGGKLTIRTRTVALDEAAARRQALDFGAGCYVVLEVSDTGHGMDEDTKARLFEPFFTTKSLGKGTGLGLATVYGVVKQSGGAITVESAPGAGCTFRVWLPREQGAVEAAQPKTNVPTPTPALRADTVLIVEDEEIVRELVCSVLSDCGYHVLCAENGVEALKLSDSHRGKIALMITDVVMPQMGGLELGRRIAERRPETHVMYVSGYSESDMSEQGILAPEADFMEKPFTLQALTRKVREILNPAPPVPGMPRVSPEGPNGPNPLPEAVILDGVSVSARG